MRTTTANKAAETAFESIWGQYETSMHSLLADAHTELLAASGGNADADAVVEFESRRDAFLNGEIAGVKDELEAKFLSEVEGFWQDGNGVDDLAVMLVVSVWSHAPEEDARTVLMEAGVLSDGGEE